MNLVYVAKHLKAASDPICLNYIAHNSIVDISSSQIMNIILHSESQLKLQEKFC